MKKISTPLLVVAVALLDASGRVLMQRRRFDSAHGGLWEFPGGKVEPGETPESAACREMEEELGVAIDPADLRPVTFANGPAGGGAEPEAGLVILLYSCRRWQGEPFCHEGEDIRWMAPEQVETLDMPPLDYPLARGLVAAVRQNSR